MNTRNRTNGKNQGRATKRGFKYWIIAAGTTATLIAYSVGNSRAIAFARVRPGDLPVSAQQQTESQRFNIQPGSLGSVLDAFQKLTGWLVVVPNETMRDIPSSGVSGVYTPELALKQLLANTGVGYRITADKAATLEIQAKPEAVEVREGPSPVSSLKFTEPLRDIPQTITVIASKVIEEQGATTLRDILQNVPGLTLTAGEGGAPAGDNLTLRGFSARNDIFIDGVRDIGPQTRDPFNLEQVEVVKGPASVFSGRGSTGGTINLVSKAPGRDRFFGGTLNLGTDDTKRVTADINAPLADRIGFRLNFLAHDSGVAGRDVVENQRWGVAPSLAFGLGTTTRLT